MMSEGFDEGARRVGRVSVGRSNVAGEYQVRVWDSNGVRWSDADYFTTNKDDAHQTARMMAGIADGRDVDTDERPGLLARLDDRLRDALAVCSLDDVRGVLAQGFEQYDEDQTAKARAMVEHLGADKDFDAPELPAALRAVAAVRVEAMRALYLGVMMRTPIALDALAPSLVELARLQHKNARADRALARIFNEDHVSAATLDELKREK